VQALVQTFSAAIWIGVASLLSPQEVSLKVQTFNPYSAFIVCMIAATPVVAAISIAVLRGAKGCLREKEVDERCSMKRGAPLAAILFLISLRPAVWVVGFVLEDSERLLVLCYWAGLLALGLPAMHVVAASGRVPNIIGRCIFQAIPSVLLLSHQVSFHIEIYGTLISFHFFILLL